MEHTISNVIQVYMMSFFKYVWMVLWWKNLKSFKHLNKFILSLHKKIIKYIDISSIWLLSRWMILYTDYESMMTWSKLLLQPHQGSLSVLTTKALFQVHKWASGLRAFAHSVSSAVIYFSSHPPHLLFGLVSSYFSLKPGLITSLENLSYSLDHVNPPTRSSLPPSILF